MRARLMVVLAAATVLAATVVADVVRLGGERWRAKHWRFVFAAVTVAIWIDAAVCLAATCVAERRAPPWLLSRPTRCLRPLLLVAHVRPLRAPCFFALLAWVQGRIARAAECVDVRGAQPRQPVARQAGVPVCAE